MGIAMPVSRRRRTSAVVLVGDDRAGDGGAKALAGSLSDCGIDALYLGKMSSAATIALTVADAHADSVEVCVSGAHAVAPLLRDLLREFKRLGHGGMSIVVHRIQ
jgi:methylmalonyl-CoA mutase cobalamin-binding subunit